MNQSQNQHVATIKALFRYPVKGMRGESLDSVDLYWHGLVGDRRFAFVNAQDSKSGFPWLTGRKKARMLQYTPTGDAESGALRVQTPAGSTHDLQSPDLLGEMEALYGAEASLVHLGRGCFDSMPVSLISQATVDALTTGGGVVSDVRRFRPNILLDCGDAPAFVEEDWLGGLLVFGEGVDAPRLRLNRHNVRCVMVNLDPDTAVSTPDVLKHVTNTRDAKAGIYASTEKIGNLRVGTKIYLHS